MRYDSLRSFLQELFERDERLTRQELELELRQNGYSADLLSHFFEQGMLTEQHDVPSRIRDLSGIQQEPQQVIVAADELWEDEPEIVDPKPPQKKKKSAGGKDGGKKLLIIAALSKHHRYGKECLNPDPIGVRQLAGDSGVAQSYVSEFFKDRFGDHKAYKLVCSDVKRLQTDLEAMNGDLKPREFYNQLHDSIASRDSM